MMYLMSYSRSPEHIRYVSIDHALSIILFFLIIAVVVSISSSSMSAGGAFGGARGYQPKPPEKGVFPLDHFGECTPEKEAYMQCLKESKNDAEKCKEKAQKYLECRMSKSLMAQQDLEELGFGKGTEKGTEKS